MFLFVYAIAYTAPIWASLLLMLGILSLAAGEEFAPVYA